MTSPADHTETGTGTHGWCPEHQNVRFFCEYKHPENLPLATRPPELWVNDVRDAGGDW